MILSVLDDLLERPTGQKLAAVGGIVLALAVLDWQYFYGPRQRELTEGLANIDAYLDRLEARPALVRARAVPAAV